jgi:hypothetical protein
MLTLPWVSKPPPGWPIDCTDSLGKSCVDYWAAAEGSGLATYSSGIKNTAGTLGANMAWGTTRLGRAWSFNKTPAASVTTAVSNGWNSWTHQQPLSVSCWLSLATTTGYSPVISNYDESISKGLEIAVEASGIPRLVFANTHPTNSILQQSTAALTANILYHVVWTYDGSSAASGVQFYINGVKSAKPAPLADTLTTTPAGTVLPRFGGRPSGNAATCFDGLLSDVAILDRAITPSEVLTLYNNPWAMSEQPFDWPLWYASAAGGTKFPYQLFGRRAC